MSHWTDFKAFLGPENSTGFSVYSHSGKKCSDNQLLNVQLLGSFDEKVQNGQQGHTSGLPYIMQCFVLGYGRAYTGSLQQDRLGRAGRE